jgi:anti-sigma factor RsiW
MSESTNMSGIHDCGGDLAAYALGALEPAEAEAFETHLAGCAICRDEFEALRGVVQALPMASPQYPAPRRLRRRIMRTVAEEPSPAHHTAPTSRLRRAPRRGRAWSPGLALGGAVAAACVAVVLAITLTGHGSGRNARLIRAQVTGGAHGSAELRVSGTRGELVVHHLTAPSRDHVYEVWLKSPRSAPVPASVLFSVSSAGNADVGLPRSLRGMSVMMVTSEPDGGTLHPTTPPVIVAQLS